MKKILLISLFIVFSQISKAQLYFPPTTGNSWDTLSPSSLGWCQDKIDTLLNFLDSKNTKAFIVLKDGKIVIEHYFDTFTVDSLWYWASAGKSLTSFLVGMAKQDGFLNLSDSTSQYLGSGWTICPPAKEGMITVLDQLRMTSGLNDLVPDNYCTDDTCLEYLADAGTRWAYHNAPYTLLDGVIENSTGQALNLYLLNKVKTPTGMTGNYYPSGYNSLFISIPRSMARFGLLMLNHGNWDGNQIMTDTTYYNEMINTSQNLNPSYGYLWWLNGKPSYLVPGLQIPFPGPLMPHAPLDMYSALGKNGQFINIVPSQNLVLVRMGDAPGVGEVPFLFNDSIWERMQDVMCGTTDINSNADRISMSEIYPNPTSGNLFIQSDLNSNYRILNLLGVEVLNGEFSKGENKLDLTRLNNGIYFIQSGRESQKILLLK
ncbi:MAG: serine hydrolase [Bacteroidetes bacterium]|nr:serine hydrolase [Bacteroidota bacterium]MBK9414335.1 serine hydrolase [Bacteroidota bacterium]